MRIHKKTWHHLQILVNRMAKRRIVTKKRKKTQMNTKMMTILILNSSLTQDQDNALKHRRSTAHTPESQQALQLETQQIPCQRDQQDPPLHYLVLLLQDWNFQRLKSQANRHERELISTLLESGKARKLLRFLSTILKTSLGVSPVQILRTISTTGSMKSPGQRIALGKITYETSIIKRYDEFWALIILWQCK